MIAVEMKMSARSRSIASLESLYSVLALFEDLYVFSSVWRSGWKLTDQFCDSSTASEKPEIHTQLWLVNLAQTSTPLASLLRTRSFSSDIY
jgi:hypothetical protein